MIANNNDESKKLIVGSGLLAAAISRKVLVHEGTCLYAAGVANSRCEDAVEFQRDRARLLQTLDNGRDKFTRIVYFSTCSISDPYVEKSCYVTHKLAMENLIAQNSNNHLIVRLPQLAGFTQNPHTLLNFIDTKIRKREPFVIWERAVRNVIVMMPRN